jgi:hypothetical protein
MFDRQMLALTKPLVDAAARFISVRGITADQVSLTGFAAGVLAALLISAGEITWAIVPLLFNRLCDGVDGAVARTGTPTERGAFLDITLDFFFYAGVPLAFALLQSAAATRCPLRSPAGGLHRHRRHLSSPTPSWRRSAARRARSIRPRPSTIWAGLPKASRPVLCFVAMCLWPDHFPQIAYAYAALCGVNHRRRACRTPACSTR